MIVMNNALGLSSKINYLFLAYVLVWPVLNKTILPIDGADRIGQLLFFISLLLNVLEKNFLQTLMRKPISLWFAWVMYVTMVWFWYGHNVTEVFESRPVPDITFVFTRFVTPFYAMLLAAYEMRRSELQLLKWIISCYIIFIFLAAFCGTRNITDDGRVISSIGNELPLGAMSMFFVASYMNLQDKLKTRYAVILFIVAFICILLAATRKAFIGLLIISLFWLIARNKMYKPQKLFILIGVLAFLYLGVQYVMDNTALGERFAGTDDAAEIYNTSDIPILNFLGDRAIFYIMGWEIFLEHPWFGVGLSNFQIETGYPLPIHSEYIVQLCEGGIVGSIIFILFYLNILKCVVWVRKSNKDNFGLYLLFLSLFLTVLFINLTAWTYQFPHYFICFGLIIGKSFSLMDRKFAYK